MIHLGNVNGVILWQLSASSISELSHYKQAALGGFDWAPNGFESQRVLPGAPSVAAFEIKEVELGLKICLKPIKVLSYVSRSETESILISRIC